MKNHSLVADFFIFLSFVVFQLLGTHFFFFFDSLRIFWGIFTVFSFLSLSVRPWSPIYVFEDSAGGGVGSSRGEKGRAGWASAR